MLFLFAAVWLWGGCSGAASAAEDHGSFDAAATAPATGGQSGGALGSADEREGLLGGICQGLSSQGQCLAKGSTIDVVDDDDPSTANSQASGALSDPPDGLWVFLEPGTGLVGLVAFFESAGTYELLVGTLAPPEK